MFYYSPYGDSGKYSRQVLPLWDEVAKWHREKKTKNLLIVKFSCESSVEAQQLCYDAGVRQSHPRPCVRRTDGELPHHNRKIP